MTIKFKTTVALTGLLSATLLLSACNKDPQTTTHQEQQSTTNNDAIGQIKQIPIKQFPATANDAHDIAVLDDYDRRFTEMSDSMEMELAKMKEANSLTPEFEQQRQKDNVRSALNMLKELELKTEQGRYIQGLLYEYWDNQAKVLEQSTLSSTTQNADTAKQVDHLNEYLHAQSQLHHWKSSQPAESKKSAE